MSASRGGKERLHSAPILIPTSIQLSGLDMYDYSRRILSSHPSRTSSIRRPSRQYTCKNGLIPLPSKTDEHSNPISRSVVSFIDLYVLAANLVVQPIGAQCRRPTRIAISNLAAGGEGVSFPAIARFFFKVGLKRLSLRPFTFSNGVTIPAGTLLALPLDSAHADEEIYSNAHEFDARFFRLCEKEGDDVLAARR